MAATPTNNRLLGRDDGDPRRGQPGDPHRHLYSGTYSRRSRSRPRGIRNGAITFAAVNGTATGCTVNGSGPYTLPHSAGTVS